MTALRVILLALIFLFPCVTAHADSGPSDWQKSFPAEQVGSYLSGSLPRIMVIAAGKEDASEATAALRGALSQSRKAALVMDQSGLGNVSSLDDQGIVKAAQKWPIERVIIVRVFPGGPSTADSAVVTIYDKTGNTISAFTTEKGTPLNAAAATGSGSGVSSEVAGAVSAVMRTTPTQINGPSAAQREWERNYIWFEDWVGVNQYGQVVAHWSSSYRGLQHEPLGGPQLYEALGRSELAADYRRKRAIRIGVGVTGGIMMAGGIAAMFWGVSSILSERLSETGSGPKSVFGGGIEYQYAMPSSPSVVTPWILTGVFLGGGLVLAIVAAAINPNPVRPEAVRQMVIEYNYRLRQRLGLPELQRVSQRKVPRAISNVALAPTVSPTGASLTAAFSF